MNQLNPFSRHRERDHSLLVRSYAKASEGYADDAWSWAEVQLVEIKSNIEILVVMEKDESPSELLQQLSQRVNDISLHYLGAALDSLTEVCKSVKLDQEYDDPLQAQMLVRQAEEVVQNLIREIFAIRGQVDALNDFLTG